MNIKLTVKDGPDLGRVIIVHDVTRLEIGRDPTAHLALPGDNYVSGHHCVIEAKRGAVRLRDVQSTDGTYLNGRLVEQETELVDGDLIKVGHTSIAVSLEGRISSRLMRHAAWSIPGFELIRPVEVDGERVVYSAMQNRLEQPVMLHFVPLRRSINPKAAERLLREETVWARLQDDRRVPTLKGAGVSEDALWFATSYIDAISVPEDIALRGPLSEDAALTFGRQAADVVAYLHQKDVIHRGLNPRSFWIRRRGNDLDVYLADLATAIWLQMSELAQVTSTLGTRISPYTPPERLIDSRRVDVRSDVYSLGAILYFVVTGQPPFEPQPGEDLASAIMHGTQLPRNQGISEELAKVIDNALAIEVQDRIPSAVALRDALATVRSAAPSLRPEVSYMDFDVLMERDGNHGYTARVVNAPGGESGAVPFAEPSSVPALKEMASRIGRRRDVIQAADAEELRVAMRFGSELHESLFAGTIRTNWHRSLAEAAVRSTGLRLRLRLSDVPELAALPWEFLYDHERDQFLCLSEETPLVRFLEVPEPVHPIVVDGPIQILVVISAPDDYPQLDVAREWNGLREALRPLVDSQLVHLKCLGGSLGALRDCLDQQVWHVLHFVGHGGFDAHSNTAVLLFEDENQRGHPFTGQDLGILLRDHLFRLVVLNACEGGLADPADPFAGVAQNLLRKGIPAVVAMQSEITDTAAITMASELYKKIAGGYPIETAISAARKAIWLDENRIEWAVPVLYSRAADGHLINVEHRSHKRP